MKNKVAIAKCPKYEYELVKKTLDEIVAVTDFPSVRGKYVLIKPNVLSDAPKEKNITTNPLVVKAVIEIVKERGAERIICGDSPGLPGASFRAKGCEIADVCEEEGVEWVDFLSSPVEHILPSGIKVPVARCIDEVDIVISVSKMKTHQLMLATGCVKNMFGIVPGLNKSPLHLRARTPEAFAEVILDIYSIHKPEYSVMDGVISMEGAGPANGTLRQTGLLLGSSSAVALDRAEAVIMGYRAKDIPLLSAMEKREKGSTEGEYPLLDPEEVAIKDFRRVPVKKRGLISALILPYFSRHGERGMTRRRKEPVFDSTKCRACSKCIEICPAKALVLKERKVVINKGRCIRCYCCHEMCPFDAIIVEKAD